MMGFFKRKDPEEDPSSIGNVLISMGLISESELYGIIEEFKASKEELLGEFIVRKSRITEYQLEFALIKQKIMRGEGDRKLYDRLLQISQQSGKRVCDSLDDLTTTMQKVNAIDVA